MSQSYTYMAGTSQHFEASASVSLLLLAAAVTENSYLEIDALL